MATKQRNPLDDLLSGFGRFVNDTGRNLGNFAGDVNRNVAQATRQPTAQPQSQVPFMLQRPQQSPAFKPLPAPINFASPLIAPTAYKPPTAPVVKPQPQNTFVRDAIRNVGDFTAASNDALQGGLLRSGANIANSFATGFNGAETDKRTNDFMRTTFGLDQNNQGSNLARFQGINNGKAILTSQPDYQQQMANSEAAKWGEATGNTQRTAIDLASMAIPAVGVEKALLASKFIKGVEGVGGLVNGGKLANFASKAIPLTASSLTASAIGVPQDLGRNQADQVGNNLLLNSAIDAALPLGLKVLGKGYRGVKSVVKGNEILDVPLDEAVQNTGKAIHDRLPAGQAETHPTVTAYDAPHATLTKQLTDSAPNSPARLAIAQQIADNRAERLVTKRAIQANIGQIGSINNPKIPRTPLADQPIAPSTIDYRDSGYKPSAVVAKPIKVKAVAVTPAPVDPTVATTPATPLHQEALKYKSADEFIDARGEPMYHGTNANLTSINDLQGGSKSGRFSSTRSVFASENPELAKLYGKNVLEGVNTGKTLDTSKLAVPHQDGIVIPKEFADYKTNPLLDARDKRVLEQSYFSGTTPSNITIDHLPNIQEYFKSKGYSTVQIPRGSDVSGAATEMTIIDPSKIKTKQQLTDIYNQAHQSLPTTPKTALPAPKTPKAVEPVAPRTTTLQTKTAKTADRVAQALDPKQPLKYGQLSAKEKLLFKEAKKAQGPIEQSRGFTGSVQAAPNVLKKVKKNVAGVYNTKTNDTLMGEAKALLSDGASIDFKNTKNLDQKVAATIQEALNQQKAGNHQAAADLFNNLSVHGTELGRGVQAFSLLENMSPESVALSVAGKIKKFNLEHGHKIPELNGDQMKIIADQITAADLLKGREKSIALNELNNTLSDFIPSSLVDKGLTIWKAGLLTSFRTHERNFIGNSVHGIAEIAKDVPASMSDALMSLKTGKRTTTTTIKGLREFGSKSTAQQMRDIAFKGYDPSETINKFDYKKITWGKNPVEQGLKRYTDIVFRTLGASDKPFYNSALARSLHDQAGAAAINAGKRGNKQFIEHLVASPPEDMMKLAIGDANTSVFKDKNVASNVVNQLKQGLDETEAGKLVGGITMPFTGVPTSILGQIVAYSPIGLTKGIAKTGRVLVGQVPELQRQAAKELGRGVIGTGIFGLGAYLAGQGLVTGQPKDQAEARQWELENKPRNSIMINGKWRSLNSIGPESLVFLAGAKANEAQKSPDGSAATYGTTIAKDFLDQSFLQGVQSPVNAITDPARYAKSYLGQLASSPIPNIVKDLSKSLDDKQRETNTVTDYVKASIPGVRNSLTEKRDVLGNSMKQEPSGPMAFLDLFNSKTPVNNPVVAELSRLNAVDLNATPSKLKPTQSVDKQKMKLTPQELDQLEQYSNGQVSKGLTAMFNSPAYQNGTDDQKKAAIDSMVTSTRSDAKTNLLKNGVTSDIASKGFSTGSGLTSSKLDANGSAYKFLTDSGNVTSTDKKAWNSKTVDSKYKSLVDEVNNSLPVDMPKLPTTNAVAEVYATYQKNKADNSWSDLQNKKESQKTVVAAYKTQLTDNETFISTLSDKEILDSAQNGQVTKSEVDHIIALDNILSKLGMTPMIGNKTRYALGYGSLASGSSGGSKSTGKAALNTKIASIGKMDATTADTYKSLQSLLASTRGKSSTPRKLGQKASVKKITIKGVA